MYQQYDPNSQPWPQQQQGQAPEQETEQNDMEEGDNSHRPPNAFILYSQAMRSEARQQNPSLSNTEVSRILGKMWKEVPNDVKLQYKQKAAKLQEEFKKNHPDYTYRKARRKRALNELLTKSSQGYPGMQMYPGSMEQVQYMMMQNQQMPAYQQIGGQPGQQMMAGMQGYPPQMPMIPGMPGSAQMGGIDQQMNTQMQGLPQQQNAMYGQYPPK